VSAKTIPTDAERPAEAEDLRKLLERAQKGDASTLPALREMMQASPGFVDLCGGDLARQAERSLLNAAAGQNLSYREAVLRKMELMRAELAGPEPAPLERLLVERIVACWLQLHYLDVRLAQSEAKLTMEQLDHLEGRRDRAHRRYLSAIKTLATVRKLALPVLQVNIAKKQINVAGPCIPAGKNEGEAV
jgi:hypothetical protein